MFIFIITFISGKVKMCGLDSSGSEYGPIGGSYEYGNEPSGSMKALNSLNS
jgi:hypothetical protein